MSSYVSKGDVIRQLELINERIPEVKQKLNNVEDMWNGYKIKGRSKEETILDCNELKWMFIRYTSELFSGYKFMKPRRRRALIPATYMPIVMYWHEDVSLAPEIVKLCMHQAQHTQTHPVLFMNKCSLECYVKPDLNIVEKHRKGLISETIYTDYLRFCLLEKYACVWLDSTVFTIEPIQDCYFQQDFCSIHGDYLNGPASIVKTLTYDCHFGQLYALGGKSNYIYSKLRQMFEEYYRYHDVNFCYFMSYIFFEYLYYHDTEARRQIQNIRVNNQKVEYLTCMRDMEASDKLYNKLFDKSTNMYKLSRHCNFNFDEKTIFGKFVKEYSYV